MIFAFFSPVFKSVQSAKPIQSRQATRYPRYPVKLQVGALSLPRGGGKLGKPLVKLARQKKCTLIASKTAYRIKTLYK